MKYLAVVIAICALCACQTNAKLTVSSQPEGAYITSLQGTYGGVAPYSFYYTIDETRSKRDAKGCWVVQGVVAQWASGARVKQDEYTLCGSAVGNYTAVVNRPHDAPNLNVDLNYAMQLQANRAAQAEAKAARSAAAWAAFASAYGATQPKVPQTNTNTYIMPGGKMMNCTTTGTVTNCF